MASNPTHMSSHFSSPPIIPLIAKFGVMPRVTPHKDETFMAQES